MHAIIVRRSLKSHEADHIAALLRDTNNYKLFADVPLPQNLIYFSSPLFLIDDLQKKDLNYLMFRKVNDFGDRKINQKTIADLLTIFNAGIWHYHKFRIYFFLCSFSYQLAEINFYASRYSSVEIYTSDRNLSLMEKFLPNIHVYFSLQDDKISFNFISLLNYFFLIALKLFLSLFSFYKLNSKKHIIVDHSQKQSCLDIPGLNPVKGNYSILYLLNKIQNDFLVINEDVIPKFKSVRTFKANLSPLFHKSNYKQYPGELILLNAICNFKTLLLIKRNSKKLLDAYSLIKPIATDMYDKAIFDFLTSLHKSSIYYLFRYLAYKKFFSKHPGFISLTTTDENSPVLKSIVDAAKANKIVTIGMQHGNIHDLHPAYIFTPADRNNNVMTDYTFVWGKFYHDFLFEKGNYPQNSLITVGQLRTDIIPLLNKNILRNNLTTTLLNEIFISGYHSDCLKLILFASQPQRDTQLRYRAARDVFSAVKNINGAFLLLKLHPAEFDDFEYYKSIADEVGCYNYKLIYFFDLYLLLAMVDIVITCFSTVGSEAVYFSKPLIILDHLKQDIQNYHANRVAWQATDADELNYYIREFLSGNLKIDNSAYDKFIQNYAFKIDGNVAQRCLSFIRSLEKS